MMNTIPQLETICHKVKPPVLEVCYKGAHKFLEILLTIVSVTGYPLQPDAKKVMLKALLTCAVKHGEINQIPWLFC